MTTTKMAIWAAGAAFLAAMPQALAQPGPGREQGAGGRGSERMFQMLDANSDGRVTREEAMGWLATRFQQADTDRDGALSLREFQAVQGVAGSRDPGGGPGGGPGAAGSGAAGPGAAGPGAGSDARPGRGDPGRGAERRAAMFRALDANSDGRLTLEEVRPAAEARFRAADANGDGAVTRDELPQRRAHRDQGSR